MFPNPAADNITVKVKIPSSVKQATLSLLNSFGQSVMPKLSLPAPADQQEVVISLKDLPSGMYFVQLSTEKQVTTEKIIIIKN